MEKIYPVNRIYLSGSINSYTPTNPQIKTPDKNSFKLIQESVEDKLGIIGFWQEYDFLLESDLNSDGIVDDADLLEFLFESSGKNSRFDINSDGEVDETDLQILLKNFGRKVDLQRADLNSDGIIDDGDLLSYLFKYDTWKDQPKKEPDLAEYSLKLIIKYFGKKIT